MTTDTLTPLDDACPRLAPHYMFRWEDSQDAYILLYPEGLIKLNLSAGEILKRCDGQSRRKSSAVPFASGRSFS